MTTLRIVQLNNERFAVQINYGLFSWDFCESKWHENAECVEYNRTWGSGKSFPDHVTKYCLIETLEEAEMVLQKSIDARSGKGIKVVKVIKKVRI